MSTTALNTVGDLRALLTDLPDETPLAGAAAYDGGTTLTTPVLATLRAVEAEPAGTAVRLRDPEEWDDDEDEAPKTFTALALTGTGLY